MDHGTVEVALCVAGRCGLSGPRGYGDHTPTFRGSGRFIHITSIGNACPNPLDDLTYLYARPEQEIPIIGYSLERISYYGTVGQHCVRILVLYERNHLVNFLQI